MERDRNPEILSGCGALDSRYALERDSPLMLVESVAPKTLVFDAALAKENPR
jgi:hypothetical protein